MFSYRENFDLTLRNLPWFTSIIIFFTKLPAMRKISLWAKHHRLAAIIIIIISKILLAIIAIWFGLLLLENNVHIPIVVLIPTLIFLVIVALLYPTDRTSGLSKKKFYIRQKSCDFVIVVCSFIMIGILANNSMPAIFTNSAIASSVSKDKNPKADEILASLKYRDKSTLTHKEKRILKKEFKNQLGIYLKAKITGNKAASDKAWLIILTIIGAIGLFLVVATLACGVGCGGSEAGAGLILIIGTAAIIWGTIALIKRIKHGPKQKKTEPEAVSQ